VGYYVGEPYLKKGDETQQRLASMQDDANPGSLPPSAARGRARDPSITSEPHLAEMRLLRDEVGRLRFWLLLAWGIQVVAGGVAVWLLALRGRRFGRRLMRQLAKLNAPPISPDAPQDRNVAEPSVPSDTPPASWPPRAAKSPPLTALTAALRRNREAIARTRVEMENRSSADLTLRTR
jgi:hypothetical protein